MTLNKNVYQRELRRMKIHKDELCNVQTIKKQNMHKKQKHFYCDCIMNYVIVLWNIPLLVRYPQEYVLLSIILLNRLLYILLMFMELHRILPL